MQSSLTLSEAYQRFKKNFLFFFILGLLSSLISFFIFKDELRFHSHASVKVNNDLYENIPSSVGSLIPFQNNSNSTFETEILQILQSRDFIIKLVQEQDILINLIASRSFDEIEGALEIDQNIYDSEKDIWLGDYSDLNNGIILERYHEIKQIFTSGLEITKLGTSFYEITYNSSSPRLSYNIVSIMIKKLNEYYRDFEIQRVKKKIDFLQSEYENAQIVELKSSITDQISQQIEKLVTLNSSEELALITIDSTSLDTYQSALNQRMTYGIVRSLMIFSFFIFLVFFYAFLGYKIRVNVKYPFITHDKF